MTRQKYEEWSPTADTIDTIERIAEVVRDYARQGYRLSVRQLYYQLVARGYIENSQQSYSRIVSITGRARNAGLLDWDAIEDRTRWTRDPYVSDSVSDMLDAVAEGYTIDKWADQSAHVEVFCEKDALSNVLEPVCRELEVSFTANRGYPSLSLMHEVGERLKRRYYEDGKDVVLLYFGDHDPSGIDMDRDIGERLTRYSQHYIEVDRLALLMAQIEEMNVPENPAKTTDSRAAAYIERFGGSSWELDAVEPAELERLCREAVLHWRDDDVWNDALDREEEMRDKVRDFIVGWEEE